jgi:transposase
MVNQEIMTDALGRRGGARQRRTIEEKRRIVEETFAPGTSVAVVARRHEVNANLVFGWRRLYQQGLLEVRQGGVKMAMLPVTRAPIRKPRTKRSKPMPPVPGKAHSSGSIEVHFPNGGRISLPGSVDPRALAHLIELLVRA